VSFGILHNIIQREKTRKKGGYAARMGQIKMHLFTKPERKTPLWRSLHAWKCNVKMDLKEAGSNGTGLTYMA
jgi:hypothetical protein